MVNTFRLRIETGTERTTIVDVFDIIQTERDTGTHLKVLLDKEQWRVAPGSKRQAGGYGPHVRNLSGLRHPDTPHAQ